MSDDVRDNCSGMPCEGSCDICPIEEYVKGVMSMTRRIVAYTDPATGKTYKTPEFNGDKSEFDQFHGDSKFRDTCDADWGDIFKTEFESVKTLSEFKEASDRAQMYYHSFLGVEVLPVEEYTCAGANIVRDSTGKAIELIYERGNAE